MPCPWVFLAHDSDVVVEFIYHLTADSNSVDIFQTVLISNYQNRRAVLPINYDNLEMCASID